MEKLFYIGIGGAVGTLGRYLITASLVKFSGRAFYIGTLSVNMLGSLVIGFLASLFLRETFLHPGFRLFFITGMLGGFTTFSSLSLETLKLLQEGRYGEAIFYVFLSITGGCTFAAIGWNLASFIPD